MAEHDIKKPSPTRDDDDKASVADEPTHAHGVFDSVYSEETIDAGYLAKARVLNEAIQDVGMGRYQWCVQKILSARICLDALLCRGLFIVTGFGWFAYVPPPGHQY